MDAVFLGTADGVLRFAGDAATPERELPGRRVGALARHRDSWLAVVDGTVVARRTPDATWTDITEADMEVRSILPAPDGAWCGTADGRVLRLLGDRLTQVTAFDTVAGRDTWHAVPSGVPYVRTLTATADDRSILAGVHVGGIVRSGNGGASWRPTIDVEVDVHEVCTSHVAPAMTKVDGGLPEWLQGNVDTGGLDASGELAAFADDGGTAYRSIDGARTWTVLAAGVGPILAVGVQPGDAR